MNAEGQRALKERGQPVLLAETGRPAAGFKKNAQLVAEGLKRLVAHLHARGISVTIIAGIPEIGRDVPELVLTSGSTGAVAGFLPDLTAYSLRNARAENILERVSKAYGAQMVAPAHLLCAPKCLIEVGGEPLYRDDDHLSDFGARWLVPQLMTPLLEGENKWSEKTTDVGKTKLARQIRAP